ncbi:MAG: hypothetical protein AAGI14_06070 [Pseudomonadota bacterium]
MIRNRLKSLYDACPQQTLDLSWALAESYGNQLGKLTYWSERKIGVDDRGDDIIEYSNFTLPGETFNYADMMVKRAEFDAQARQLIPFVEQYLKAFRATLSTIGASNLSERDRIVHYSSASRKTAESWERAIAELEMTK